jgi:hypothetical protein
MNKPLKPLQKDRGSGQTSYSYIINTIVSALSDSWLLSDERYISEPFNNFKAFACQAVEDAGTAQEARIELNYEYN